MKLNKQQEKLYEFVQEQHGSQVRKYTGDPYHLHCFAVANIVSEFVPNSIEIALCHDLLEDTTCTPELLTKRLRLIGYSEGYSTSVVKGVINLTDVFTHQNCPELNRQQRKNKEAYRMSYIGETCQSIKYADIIDNTISIIQHDKNFASVYLNEIVHLLSRIRQGNIFLLIQCGYTVQLALNEIQSIVRTKDTDVAQV